MSFGSLIPEYHTAGEASFRDHLTKALQGDKFFIAPEDLKIVVDPKGTVQFSLKYMKKFRILVFPMSKDVVFEKEVPLSAG